MPPHTPLLQDQSGEEKPSGFLFIEWSSLLAVSVAALVVVWAVMAYSLTQRAALLEQARADLLVHGETSSLALDRTFVGVGLVMGAIQEDLLNRVFSDTYSPIHFHESLARRMGTIPALNHLVLYDAHGQVAAESLAHPPRSPTLAATALFQNHQSYGAVVQITPPGHNIAPFDPDALLYSRLMIDSDGLFDGVAVAEINADHLRESLSLVAGRASSGIVVDLQGQPLVALPPEAHPPAAVAITPDQLEKVQETAQGEIAAVYPLYELPLLLMVTQDKAALLRQWQRTSLFPSLMVCLAVVIFTIILLIAQARLGYRNQRNKQALEQSQKQLDRVLKGSNDGWWDWDMGNDTIVYSPRWWNMLGYAENELPAGPTLWRQLLHPDDEAKVNAALDRASTNDQQKFEIIFRLKHRDGHYISVLSRGSIWRDSQGRMIRLSGSNSDITARVLLERALSKSETLYRGIFENVSDGLFLVQVEGPRQFRYLRTNRAYQAGLRLTPETLAGQTPEALFPPEQAATLINHYADCVASNTPLTYEETLPLAQESRTWLTSLTPLRDEQGAITTLIGISHDVTETRRQADVIRASREQLFSYFTFAPLGIYITDMQGRYKVVNPMACQQSGYSAEDLGAMSITDYLPPQSLEQGQALFESTLREGYGHAEIQLQRKDGSLFWAMLATGVLPEDRIIGFVEDISDRKAMEEELHRSNAELEQFAYVVSHDLRQPLRMVNSYLQLLERRLGDTLTEDAREFLDFARNGAMRMDTMLVGLLTYSRIGRLGQPMATVQSRNALEDALAFLRPQIDDCGAKIEILGEWPPVWASADELVRLFQNLIGNALKYRRAGASPTICLTVAPAEGGLWRFSVRDDGIGIPPDQTNRLFKVFQRLHTQAAYEGTGIGLAICRKIAERHGGEIWVDSAGDDAGSTFHVTLPVMGPEKPESGRIPPGSTGV